MYPTGGLHCLGHLSTSEHQISFSRKPLSPPVVVPYTALQHWSCFLKSSSFGFSIGSLLSLLLFQEMLLYMPSEKMDYLPTGSGKKPQTFLRKEDLECIFIYKSLLLVLVYKKEGMRNELTLSTYGQQITYPLHGKRA